jgi:hypothetical protein
MVADPIAAIVSYTVSSAVLIFSTVVRAGGTVPNIDHRGAPWFAAVGPCNGLRVLAIEYGPVAVASPPSPPAHPLVTPLLSRVLLRKEYPRPLIARATAA